MKKVFVIYNPVSGRKKMRNLEQVIRSRLEKFKCQYDWYETKVSGNDFSQIANNCYDLVIAVGGDGTVSEVATYMVKNKIKTALGIVGTGSTNMLAIALGIPIVNSSKAVDFALKNGGKAIDVGLVDDRIFLIAAGKGYDNVFMRGATRKMKRKVGFFAYVWSFFTTYFVHPSCQYQIEVDGVMHRVEAKTVLVFNFFRLSGDKLGLGFEPDDGVFEVVAINPTSFWSLLNVLSFFASRKRGGKHSKVKFFEARERVRIRSDKDRGYQLDGDVFDDTKKDLEIKILKRGVKVVYTS